MLGIIKAESQGLISGVLNVGLDRKSKEQEKNINEEIRKSMILIS